MDRSEFMNHVYWLLSEDPDNNRANSIIDAADEYAESVKALPTVQSDVPVINVGDMISRRAATTIPVMPKEHRHYQTNNLDDAYEQGWTDLQECIEKLPPVQPTLMRSIGKLVGYTGNKCPNCGRLRVERYESGLEICEKCNWCEQTKSYWLDWEEG